jgi:enoyl-CoA hydratase/carnithine racemase
MNKNLVEYNVKNHTAIISLNRPEVHNSINREVIERLEELQNEIYSDEYVRSIILTASGNESFCSGGDLKYFSSLNTPAAVREMSLRMQKILSRFWEGEKPVIAAVNGQALGGGCEILTACHIRIAADHARFGFRQAANGITTGWGGGVRLFQQMNKTTALKLLLTSEQFDAKAALQIGFIDSIAKSENLMDRASKLTGEINHNPPEVIQKFHQMMRLVVSGDIKGAEDFQTDSFLETWNSPLFQKVLRKYRES